jgi:pimeloyl-ACP methyl ester carboxylesterase
MPKQLLLLAFLLSAFFAAAQNNVQRYLNPVFKTIVQRTETYAIKGKDTLQLDLYIPKEDELKSRPTLIYVHGGGFAGGVRDDSLTRSFAFQMAQRGFVVASISYRLTMKGKSFSCDQARANKIRTFQLAVEDIQSATNYLLDKDKPLGIDRDNVVLIGSSAGAEAVLHAAYWPETRLLKSAPGLPRNFKYAGLISFAGAIVEKSGITRSTAIPTALFHGTCDQLVPYGTAAHHYCAEGTPGYMTLHGSHTLASHLFSLGASYLLLSHCGGGHGWASYPMGANVPLIAAFLKEQVIEKQHQQLHYIYSEQTPCEKVSGLPYCRQ